MTRKVEAIDVRGYLEGKTDIPEPRGPPSSGIV